MNDTHGKGNISATVELFQLIMYTPTFILGLLFNIMALWFLQGGKTKTGICLNNKKINQA